MSSAQYLVARPVYPEKSDQRNWIKAARRRWIGCAAMPTRVSISRRRRLVCGTDERKIEYLLLKDQAAQPPRNVRRVAFLSIVGRCRSSRPIGEGGDTQFLRKHGNASR